VIGRLLERITELRIALSCLASITLLPALLATGYFRREKASMLGEPPREA